MGIMYKLLRHNKSIKMDLRKLKQNHDDTEQAMLPENDEMMQAAVEAEANTMQQEQQQFTAEHILQLCKFLAEKSKRNKNLQKYYESGSKSQLTRDYANAACEYVEHDESKMGIEDEAMPILQHRIETDMPASTALETTSTNILTDKFVSTTNSCNNFNLLSTACSLQHTQSKRDILLKIRRQILERKRLRRLAHVQQDLAVWRPW